MSVLDELFGDSLAAKASPAGRGNTTPPLAPNQHQHHPQQRSPSQSVAAVSVYYNSSTSSPQQEAQRARTLSLLSTHFTSPNFPSPSTVWMWILNGRFAEALTAIDAVGLFRRAEWESQQLQRCRSNDDELELAIAHRDRMRICRAETLTLHAGVTFCIDFPNVALQAFLSEKHCTKARSIVGAKLQRQFAANFEGCQAWSLILEDERKQLRRELGFASEAVEALVVTQAHTVQELILSASLIQINRAVFFLCATLLPVADTASAAGGGSKLRDDDDDDDDETENDEADDEPIEQDENTNDFVDDENQQRYEKTATDDGGQKPTAPTISALGGGGRGVVGTSSVESGTMMAAAAHHHQHQLQKTNRHLISEHALLAAAHLIGRPSWKSLASLNRSRIVVQEQEQEQEQQGRKKQQQHQATSSSSSSSSLLKEIAASVQRCMRVCQKFKSGGKLEARVLVSCSVMLAELQSALDVALPEALASRSSASSSSSSTQNKSNSNITKKKCAISGAVLRESAGDRALTIFVPKRDMFIPSPPSDEMLSNINTTTSPSSRSNTSTPSPAGTTASEIKTLENASLERGAASDHELIVDGDIWEMYVRHCSKR